MSRLARVVHSVKKKIRLRTWISIGLLAILIPIAIVALYRPSSPEAAWFDDSYGYRRKITFTHNTAITDDRRVSITVDTSALTTDKMQADCDDTRFTDINGKLLRFQEVSGCDTATTQYDVVINPTINGENVLYLYYGNPAAANASEDISAVTSLSPSGGAAALATEEKGAGPIGYWSLNQGVDNTCPNGTDDICDSSSNQNSMTRESATWATDDFCVVGKCLKLDGTDDYASVADPANGTLDVGTGDLSISVWAKRHATGREMIVSKKSDSGGSVGYALYFDNTGGGETARLRIGDGTDSYIVISKADLIKFNQWHHIVAVVDRDNENNSLIYIDGKEATGVGSGVLANVGDISNSNSVRIGINSSSTDDYHGFIDEVKIYNYALTNEQALQEYNRGSSALFGASNQKFLSDGLVGYWKMDEASWNGTSGEVIDSSGNGNNATATANATTSGGKFAKGGTFDGTDDLVSLDNMASVINNENTISVWVKGSRGTNNWDSNATAIALNNSASTRIFATGSDPKIRLRYSDNSSITLTETHSEYVDNTWYHYVLTITPNIAHWYVDGQLYLTVNPESGKTFDVGTTPDIVIGTQLNGEVDEARIYNRALSPAEVQSLYNWAPGPVGYWNMEENTGTTVNDISGNGTSLSMNGYDSNPWTSGKYGSALQHNDAAYSAASTNESLYDFENTTFTATGWFKVGDTSSVGTNYMIAKNCQTGGGWCVGITNNGLVVGALKTGSNTVDRSSQTAYDDNVWHHFAVVFTTNTTTAASQDINIYVDGRLNQGSVLLDFAYAANDNNITIGGRGTGTDSPFTGALDELKIYNYARTPGQIIEDMNGGHPIGGSPVGSQLVYWNFDEQQGQTTNNSGYGSGNGTLGTNTSASTDDPAWKTKADCKINGCLDFDGGDYVQTASGIDLTNKSFTTTAWAKRDGIGGLDMIFGQGSQSTREGLHFGFRDSNQFTCALYSDDLDSTQTFTDTDWHHWACVYNADTNTMSLYRDGHFVQSHNTSDDYIGTGTFYIGRTGWGDSYFNGNLDEVKIYNTALTAEQVSIDMNANSAIAFGSTTTSEETQDIDSGNPPVLLYSFDQKNTTSQVDTSGNGNTGTISTVASSQYVPGKIGAALNFADTDHIIASDSNSLDATSGLTLSFWVKPNDLTSAEDQYVINKADAYFLAIRRSFVNVIDFRVYVDGSYRGFSGGPTLTEDVWQHVVATYDSTSHEMKIYVDGRHRGTTTLSSLGSYTINASTQAFEVAGAGGSPHLNGVLDELKVYDYARSQAQVAYDYNRGLPIAHWQFDECSGSTAYDASGNELNATIVPGASGNTSVGECTSGDSSHMWADGATGKINSSLGFDGTNDYAHVSSPNLPTGDFTYSLWFYQTLNSTDTMVYAGDGSGGNEFKIDRPANTEVRVRIDDATRCSGGPVPDINTWNHFAVTRSGGTITGYLNGKVSCTGTEADTLNFGSCPFVIGGDDASTSCNFSNMGEFWQGNLDDIRIYNYALSANQILKVMNDNSGARFAPSTGQP